MKVASALGLGALSFGTSALAQDAVPRRLDFGATAVTTYESNLLRLPDDSFRAPGQERDDLRFTPSFTVDLQVPFGRQSVYLTGLAGYDFYANNKDLNSERIQLDGGGTVRLSTCNTQLGVSFSRRQSDLSDFVTRQRIENTETATSFDSLLSCESAGGLRPTLGYAHERVKNGDELRKNGNFTADTFSAGIGYGRPWLGEIGLNASYRRGRYDERQGPGASDRVDTYSAGINFSRKVGSQLTGSASASFTRVDAKLPGVEDFKGLSWSLDLAWDPGTRFRATIGASRQVQQSNLLDISYAIVDQYNAQVVYALGDRMQVSLAGNYSRRSFRDSPLTPAPILRDEDRTYRLQAAASYTASRRLSFSLDTSAEQRRSDNVLFDYDNFIVAVTTRLTV